MEQVEFEVIINVHKIVIGIVIYLLFNKWYNHTIKKIQEV